MSFTVGNPKHDERHEDGLLRGVADGLARLFPVLDHFAGGSRLTALDPRKRDDDDQLDDSGQFPIWAS